MKLTLENIVWGKMQWERTRLGGVWVIPCLCGVMQKTAKGFSLIVLMPYEEVEIAAKQGFDVPATAADLLAYQRHNFNVMKEHFEAAGLDFDDPQDLLTVNKERGK